MFKKKSSKLNFNKIKNESNEYVCKQINNNNNKVIMIIMIMMMTTIKTNYYPHKLKNRQTKTMIMKTTTDGTT